MTAFEALMDARHGPWFRPWVVVLAASVAWTLLVLLDGLPDEAELIREVQSWGFPGAEVADAVRDLTTTSFVVVLGVVVAVMHALERDRRAAMVLIVLLIALVAVQGGLKELVDRPRPSEAVAGIEVRATQTSPSFPAGHVMSPTVVYGWVIAVFVRGGPGRAAAPAGLKRSGAMETVRAAAHPGWLLLAAFLAGVLVLACIVNVYLGVHWPSDVVGGYAWGLVLLLPALSVYERARGTSVLR